MAACDLRCIANATCRTVKDGVNTGSTCRCNDGFEGNGFVKCDPGSAGHLDEHHILMIILVVLLFVGLVVLMIYFLCKRKYGDYSRPLVESESKDAYDDKWDGLFHQMSQKTEKWVPGEGQNYSANVPPPYTNPPATHMTSFGGEAGPADEECTEEADDDIKEVDNPTYATVCRNANDNISEASSNYDNPVYEAEEEVAVVETEEEVVIPMEESTAESAEEATLEEAPTKVVEAEPAIDPAQQVEVTVTKMSEDDNMITAHIKTPNVTVNLNINVPIPPHFYTSQESFLDKANTSQATDM